jgi:poly [ADP-ribose] polymerase 10/14/15
MIRKRFVSDGIVVVPLYAQADAVAQLSRESAPRREQEQQVTVPVHDITRQQPHVAAELRTAKLLENDRLEERAGFEAKLAALAQTEAAHAAAVLVHRRTLAAEHQTMRAREQAVAIEQQTISAKEAEVDARDVAEKHRLQAERRRVADDVAQLARNKAAFLQHEQQVEAQVQDISRQQAVVAADRRAVELRENARLQLPTTWAPMGASTDMAGSPLPTVVEVGLSDPERAEVVRRFAFTCGNKTVHRVERVQNPALWWNYVAYRDCSVACSNGGEPNEMRLFHGCDGGTMDLINTNGFNRSYSKVAAYGKGVYFARDSSYSANPRYSEPDGSSGVQRMYLARVAVGAFVHGASGMVDAPKRNASTHAVFDSVVDRVPDPTIFVVFRDYAAYPEYVIHFS